MRTVSIKGRIKKLEAGQAPELPEYEEWYQAHERVQCRIKRSILSTLLTGVVDYDFLMDEEDERLLAGDTPERAVRDHEIEALGFRHRSPYEVAHQVQHAKGIS